MKALLVSVNGKRICLAGVPDNVVLATHVTWVQRLQRFGFNVSGLEANGQQSEWTVPKLAVGDEVTIKLMETDVVDPPTESGRGERHTPDEAIER